MSLNSATGGGSVTPGWYTDPHDPRQLRWWSGEGWTEHVSPGAAPVAAQPVAAEPAVASAPVASAPVAAGQDQDAPLPSRRALRDPSAEANDATAAAEAALAAQAAHQQAQHPDPQAQASAASLPAAYAAPQATQLPSAPVPTLPVAPTSFLEQQGYTPLEVGSPSTSTTTPAATGSNLWGVPAAPQSVASAPQAFPAVQDPAVQIPTGQIPAAQIPSVQTPAVQTPAVQTPAVQTPAAQTPAAQVPPVGTAQPTAWNQPVQPEQPPIPAQPNAWNQPVSPVQPLAPAQPAAQGWGAPAAATGGMDSLFGTAPSDPLAGQGAQVGQNPQATQWGLTPTDGDPRGGQQADAVPGVAGSSTFWAWLIAISPILAAGSITYVLLATKSALTSWQFEAAVAAPFLLVLLFALADRSALLTLGHTQPRSPAWALLSAPVYLIVRAAETRREDGTGTVLTLAWFFSFIVAVAGIVGYGLLTHHALIAGLPS